MKILFEVPFEASKEQDFKFEWLDNKEHLLFTLESGKKLKIIDGENEFGKELQSANLARGKCCTTSAWNKDGSLLALVVDYRHVFIWEFKVNRFTQLRLTNLTGGGSNKKNRISYVEFVVWSQLENKLALCLTSGQIILCYFSPNYTERFIDNSQGVLERIVKVESSKEMDLFVCMTRISEVLVMTFEGEMKYYSNAKDLPVLGVRMSSPFSERFRSDEVRHSFWLAYHTESDRIIFKKIPLNDDELSGSNTPVEVMYHEESEGGLVDIYWINATQLVACYTSGLIMVLKMKNSITLNSNDYQIESNQILDLKIDNESLESDEKLNHAFQMYEFVCRQECLLNANYISPSYSQVFSLAASTSYRLFYFELLELDTEVKITCEKVDSLDLTDSLSKIKLQINKIKWCRDGSKLALQISNGHIFVYQARLQNCMIASYGSKTAYMSGSNEVTVLEYGDMYRSRSGSLNDTDLNDMEGNNNNALTLNVDLKPSCIGIGATHLAIALNNKVRYYIIGKRNRAELTSEGIICDEQEYTSIVVGLGINSHFVAILFSEGRLKLHAIHRKLLRRENSDLLKVVDSSFDDDSCDERFFPDPSKPESITSFVLTESNLIYSTKELYLYVFNLESWSIVQTLDHSKNIYKPIFSLKANEIGNKCVCLLKPQTNLNEAGDNVYLYDLYTNQVMPFDDSIMFKRIFDRQLGTLLPKEVQVKVNGSGSRPNLNRIIEAIWDTDRKTVLLIEQRLIHIFLVISHTLEREETSTLYVMSTDKASSYKTLYASQGIVSFKTSLGRVINSVWEFYDDELKLSMLEQDIQAISKNELSTSLATQARIMSLKLDFLLTILPIHSVSKCKEICEHLMTDDRFNLRASNDQCMAIKQIIWKQLAAWAIYTLNLNFASLIYRKYGLAVHARVLQDILSDAHELGLDSRSSVCTRALVLLDCHMEDE